MGNRKIKHVTIVGVGLLGGSAALGIPDPGFNAGAILEVMLAATYPDAKFEVVTAAMTAINSHVVLPIARECPDRQPDLFIINLGNNHVDGPIGAGTIFARSKSQASLGMIHRIRSGSTAWSSRKSTASIPVLPAPITT